MVVRDEVGRHLQMTQGDATKFYNEHKDEFQQPEQIQLSEILVPTPETATAAELAQAEAKAKDLKAQLDKGSDFADLAKKYSGGPSAAQGGELGMFKRGSFAKVIEDQTFDLKPGQSTQPIRTRQGFVILKVTKHDQAGPAAMKDVEPQIEEALYMQQMQPALRTYLTKLREDSYVDIQPGFVDSGASAAETKPIFTAYAPPPVKKKEDKEKARFDRNGPYTNAKPKQVIASPDTTGTRTLTGADAPKAGIDPVTGLAIVAAPPKPVGTPGKKMKREKVRFGQAPRNSLPAGLEEAAPVTAAAPGAVMASNGTSPPESANLNDNPLTPHTDVKQKTRFAAKEPEVKAKKVQVATAKVVEKNAAKPVAETAEQKATEKAQAAPLGVSGDTSKKPAKPKKVKGQPKQRLEDKPANAKPAAPAPVDQTVNPALAPTAVAPAPAPTTPQN
jgi:peptidyl-prolyl cis-trans isomerase SurA